MSKHTDAKREFAAMICNLYGDVVRAKEGCYASGDSWQIETLCNSLTTLEIFLSRWATYPSDVTKYTVILHLCRALLCKEVTHSDLEIITRAIGVIYEEGMTWLKEVCDDHQIA